LGRAGTGERAVAEGAEVAAPGLESAEDARVAESDVDGAVAAGGEARERAGKRAGERRQVGVGPADVGEDFLLPGAGPLAAVVAALARDRENGDERGHGAGADQP